jgi:hypothetical protein
VVADGDDVLGVAGVLVRLVRLAASVVPSQVSSLSRLSSTKESPSTTVLPSPAVDNQVRCNDKSCSPSQFPI